MSSSAWLPTASASSRAPGVATLDYARRVLAAPMPPQPAWLATSQSVYEQTMDVKFPISVILLYLAGVLLLNPGAKGVDRTKTPVMRTLLIAHNIALCLYSAWTFVMVTPPIARAFLTPLFSEGSFRQAFCGIEDNSLWVQTIAPVGYIFYLSKVYEILDSIILLLKGKRVSLLQAFHHSGAIACMYAGVRYQGMPIWIFCCFNSFIHTLMYAYYAMTAMGLPFPKPLKRSLTSLQIGQFIVGGSIAASYFAIRLPEPRNSSTRCVQTPEARFATRLNLIYLAPLCLLFIDFARRTYSSRTAKATTQRVKTQ